MDTRAAFSRMVATLGSEWSIAPQRIEQCLHWAAEQAAYRPTQTAAKDSGGIELIRIYGAMSQHYSDWTISYDWIGQAFDKAMASTAGTVLLDIDSPGGGVYGLKSLADKVYRARGRGKRIVALANSVAASAAFWLGTAAEEFYVAPQGDVGSVGVWSAHEDWSKYLDEVGIKTTLVSAGKFKTEGHPYGPLDDEARREMQKRVDAFAKDFHLALARNRNTTVTNVIQTFGEGRLVQASAAVNRGMVDGTLSLDQLLVRYGITPPSSNRAARAAYLAQQVEHERDLRVRELRSYGSRN